MAKPRRSRQQLAAIQFRARKGYLIAGGAALAIGGLYLLSDLTGGYAVAWSGGKPIGTIKLRAVGQSAAGKTIYLREDVADRAIAMAAAAAKAGIKLRPNSGFRSVEEQAKLYTEALARAVSMGKLPGTTYPETAKPGYSNHGAGTAIDWDVGLTQADFDAGKTTPAFTWARNNSAAFGLFPLRTESWHYSTDGH